MPTTPKVAGKARHSRFVARAFTSTALVFIAVNHASAQDSTAPCVGEDCSLPFEAGTAAPATGEATTQAKPALGNSDVATGDMPASSASSDAVEPVPVSTHVEPAAEEPAALTSQTMATDDVDMELPTVSVEAAAPEPEPVVTAAPARAPVRRPVPAQPVAAPPVAAAPMATVPVVAGDSRFSGRPERVQDRTEIGRLSVDEPVNGTTVSQEEIGIVRSTSSETDLLLRVPGISMIRNIRIPAGGKGYTNNLVDGFSVRSQSLGSSGFLDDVNLWDVEAVDITRGPASVLYSSKAVGGTVNVITRTPPDTQESEAFVEAGAYGFRRAGLNFAGPLGNSETLKYSLSVNTLSSDGWRERSAQDKSAVSGKIVWAPTDRTELTFRAEYVDHYIEHSGRLTQDQFDTDWQQAQFINLYEDTQAATLSAVLKHEFDNNRRVEFSYAFSNTSGTDACPSGCSSTIASLRQIEVDHTTHNFRGLYVQDYARMEGRLSLGVDAFYSEKNDDTWQRGRNSMIPIALIDSYAVNETSIAPFIQYEFTPIENVRFSLGARYENYTLDAVEAPAFGAAVDGRKTYSDLVKKAGVTWEYAPNRLFWASVAEGYFVPSTSYTITDANARPLPAESSLTYSLGFRGELSAGRFGYDVGLYHSTIRDQAISLACGGDAVLCPGDPTGDYAAAAGKVSYQGLEASVYWRAHDKLRLDMAYTYAHNKYRRFVTDTMDYSGNILSASPQHHINLRATYEPAQDWDIELEADWISDYYTNASNTDSYQRPILWNLRTSYDLNDRVQLFAGVENLFDVKYAKRVSASDAAIPVRGFAEGYTSQTLRFGVSTKF